MESLIDQARAGRCGAGVARRAGRGQDRAAGLRRSSDSEGITVLRATGIAWEAELAFSGLLEVLRRSWIARASCPGRSGGAGRRARPRSGCRARPFPRRRGDAALCRSRLRSGRALVVDDVPLAGLRRRSRRCCSQLGGSAASRWRVLLGGARITRRRSTPPTCRRCSSTGSTARHRHACAGVLGAPLTPGRSTTFIARPAATARDRGARTARRARRRTWTGRCRSRAPSSSHTRATSSAATRTSARRFSSPRPTIRATSRRCWRRPSAWTASARRWTPPRSWASSTSRTGRLAFRHPLARSAVYQEAAARGPPRRS